MALYNSHPEECPGPELSEEWDFTVERDVALRSTVYTRSRHKHTDANGPCRAEWVNVEIPNSMMKDPRFRAALELRGN